MAWVNRAGSLPECDTANNIARLEVTVTAEQGPGPGAIIVEPSSGSYAAGDEVWASGAAPDGSYCLLVVPNGIWTVGQPAPAARVARASLTAVGGAFTPCCVWHGAKPGAYDLLVTGAGCPDGGAVLAAFDAGTEAGFEVNGEEVPLFDRSATILAVALTGLLGAWVLRRGSCVRDAAEESVLAELS